MGLLATVAIGFALLLDWTVGEWPERVHPVAVFGDAVSRFDRSWSHPRGVGLLLSTLPPLSAAVGAWAFVRGGMVLHPAMGTAAAGIVLFTGSSLSELLIVTRDVVELAERDLEEARGAVTALVGRDTSTLGAGAVRSAALESAAENLADGLVGPLVAFVLGAQVSLAVGAGAAAFLKAVNTLDSMVGYPSKSHGTASARLDDVLMWGPARVSAGLVAIVGGRPSALFEASVLGRDVPSPNSGWPMGAMAAVLDVELQKPGVYTLNRDGGFPSSATARDGIDIVERAGLAAFGLAGVIAWW
ncbi:MAG: CobD/CbiB family cobalamin biosynthesis protein [Halodesulfurarchaeum sp.]